MTKSHDEAYAVPTLGQLMDLHGNDWTQENAIFRQITSRHLDDRSRLRFATNWNHLSAWDVARTISLVIPSQLPKKKSHLQLTLRALRHQSFFKLGPRRSILEIVIVNDGPASPDDVFDVAKYKPDRAELRVFCLKERLGPARARNVGLYYSRGDIIFFLDSDMLLEPDLITEHIIRHEYIPNLALLSFREDIEETEAEQRLSASDSEGILDLNAEWSRDWKARKHKVTKSSSLNGTRLKVGSSYSIYDLTKGLRKWEGQFHGEGTHGDRNLPSAFATSCVSVRREHLIAVGGFRSHYNGWGIEDRDLGSRLLGRGVRLITVRSAGSRHVKHPESPPHEKDGDKEANIARYNSLIREPYHEMPENLTKQINHLLKDQMIYPALEFQYGSPLPRTQASPSSQSPLDLALETLLHQADAYFRRSAQSMNIGESTVNVTEGDLKWRVMLEDAPGGMLSVIVGINTSHRRDGSMRLSRSAGWVSFVVQNSMNRCRGGNSGLLDLALRPMTVDFAKPKSKSVQIAHTGLSPADKERTDYYKFLAAAPIVIHLGWPQQNHYCIGAVSVHSAISIDIMRKLATEDEPIVSAIADSASNEYLAAVMGAAKPQPNCDLLRGVLRDLSHSCGDLLLRYRSSSDPRLRG